MLVLGVEAEIRPILTRGLGRDGPRRLVIPAAACYLSRRHDGRHGAGVLRGRVEDTTHRGGFWQGRYGGRCRDLLVGVNADAEVGREGRGAGVTRVAGDTGRHLNRTDEELPFAGAGDRVDVRGP